MHTHLPRRAHAQELASVNAACAHADSVHPRSGNVRNAEIQPWLTGKSLSPKHPFDREKHQMQELKASRRNHLSIRHMKANLSILCAFEKLSVWGKMCSKILGLLFIYFSRPENEKLNALCANPDANHERASLRSRPHANVSSVAHYNSNPALEEWHSSKATPAPPRNSAREGKGRGGGGGGENCSPFISRDIVS